MIQLFKRMQSSLALVYDQEMDHAPPADLAPAALVLLFSKLLPV